MNTNWKVLNYASSLKRSVEILFLNYFSASTPRCKKPVFLNLSAYSPVKKLDFENITADKSKKAEGEGDVEQAIDSKLDGSVEVARDSYAVSQGFLKKNMIDSDFSSVNRAKNLGKAVISLSL